MSHDLHFKHLGFVTQSDDYFFKKSNFIENFDINYKNKNLYYDSKKSTFIAFIPNKSCLFLSVKYQPEQQQFNVKFFYGYFFQTKLMEFIMKIPKKDFVHLEKVYSKVSNDDNTDCLDEFSQYVVNMINHCPFSYAKKKELKKIGQSDIPVFWGFIKTSLCLSINSEKKTQVFRCHLNESKDYSQMESYQIIKNRLRKFYKNGGVDFIDKHMKNKHSLVRTPYYVSQSILDPKDWFLISDFSTVYAGYMEYFHGRCSYIFKSDSSIRKEVQTNSEHDVSDMLSKYSMDYFEYNNRDEVEKKIIALGLDPKKMTENDFEVISMYQF